MIRVSELSHLSSPATGDELHSRRAMESSPSWRARLSFKNATIAVSLLNFFLLLHAFFSALHRPSSDPSRRAIDPVQLRYIMESIQMRRAMEPTELIKRVREIEQEVFIEPETEKPKVPKRTTAVDLSNRLKDLRATNDASSLKALEEWRKRKMDRARQREIEKNGTLASQV